MKIEIYFLNTKLTTEINKNILVKDLIYDLKQFFNSRESNYILFDSNQTKLKDNDIISVEKDKNVKSFYLIKSLLNKNIAPSQKETEKLKMNQLIMKCTGAKKALEPKGQIPLIPSRFGFLDIFDDRNNLNRGRENNSFDRLINILQVLEENNIALRGVPPVNNAPVEADEQALRELQDMGFPEDRARQALINSRNDINRATELLLGEV